MLCYILQRRMKTTRSRLRRRIRRDRFGVRTLFAIAVSLGANALLLWALLSAGAFTFRAPGPARPVSLAHLSQSEWAANRAVTGQPPPHHRASRPFLRRRSPAGKIVELAPDAPGEDAVPKDGRYLSDKNRRVEKETVSRYAGNSPNLLSKPSAGSPGRETSGEGGRAERKTEAKEGAPGQKGTGAEHARPPRKAEKEKLALAPSTER